MSDFDYIVRTEGGARKTGSISAENYNAAVEKLQSQKLTVVKLNEADTSFDFVKPFLNRLSLEIEKIKNSVPLNILVFFTRQLATMFSAGLTIERALYFLKAEEKNKRFKKALEKIEDNVKKGLLLSDTLERHPGIFTNLYISLVRAGEVSGKLSETLEELSLYLETVEDTQRKVKSAMYYPVFIIIFLIFILFVTFTFLIPKFSSVYEQLGTDLPYYTVLFVNISVWLQNNIFSVILFSIISILSVWIFTLTDTGRLVKDRFLLRLPIFGNLIQQNILSKFGKTFGILISAGVSVMDSMDLIIKVVNNRVYELALIKAKKNIENGVSISEALKSTNVFPPIMIQLLSTGEETGEIDNLSLKASDFYSKQVNAIVDRLTSLIEPILIIFVGVVIGAVIVVTYLPIFHFGSALAQ
ncbi:MAG: pilus assembly protein PilC [Candidatus Marinimicrobia bacterium]|nr:pilus assembly protein PilC [Candidatus Neomarinimicrobiota bacterium]